MNLRQTHTVATMDVSQATFDEIAKKLNEAGYDHVFSHDGRQIDMTGIAIVPEVKSEYKRSTD